MGSVWPIVIVETLPNGELLHEIYIVPVGEPLVELILVGAVRSLDLPIELRCPRLDVNVFHAQVRDVPMEKSLELVAGLTVPTPPETEGLSRDPEAPARFPDVAVVLCVLEDPLLSPDFSLIFGHFDPPGCPVSSQ